MFLSGHTYDYELLQYIESCFCVMKKLFTTITSLKERIGVLYLMYAMYFKQQTKEYCKYRFTISDWYEMKSFYNQIHNDIKYIQVRMVFWRLWHCNAFRFVESDADFGLESTMSVQNHNENVMNFQKIAPQMLDIAGMLKDESSGVLSGLDILQAGYNEMKEHLTKVNENCTGLRPLNVIEPIAIHMDNIESTFLAPVPKRRRRPQQGRKNVGEASVSEANDKNEKVEFILGGHDEFDVHEDDTDSETEPAVTMNTTTTTDDSDGECLNIGSKRIHLKRKAMIEPARMLIHGSSYANNAPITSPPKVSKSEEVSRKWDSKNLNVTRDSTDDETTSKSTRIVEFDDQRGTVRIMQAELLRKPRTPKNSAVRRQFYECPT